jgi:hypothetical protein
MEPVQDVVKLVRQLKALASKEPTHRPGFVFRRGSLTTVGLVLVCAASASASPLVVSPSTIISFDGVAREFDYDRGRVAWIDSAWALRTRSLRGGGETKLLYTNPYEEVPELGRRLFLEGQRLVWLSSRGSGTFGVNDHVYTATVGAKKGRRLFSAAHTDGVGGSYVTGLAGGASSFTYGVVTVTGPDGELSVSSGGIWSIVAGTPRRVPGVPPSFVFARGSDRILAAPAEVSQQTGWVPLPGTTLEVRNATTGALMSSFHAGRVGAAALAGTVAVVFRAGRIYRYDSDSGQLIGSTVAPAGTAAELDADGSSVVFRTKNAIEVIDAATGRISIVARTGAWSPSAVAVQGRTVVWTEAKRIKPGEASAKTFRSRIRATSR